LNTASVLLFDSSSATKLAEIQSRPTSYGGIAYRPGDRQIWASETSLNGPDSLLVAGISDLGLPAETRHISLDGHPVPVGIAFSPDGKTVYVVFSRDNSLGVIDAEAGKLLREIPVGVAPFAVAVTRQGTIFVSNRGGRRPKPGDNVAPGSGSAVLTDPLTGAAVSGTVSVIDPRTWSTREVAVGLAPSGMALAPDQKTLAVVNGHSDTVSLIDAATLRVKSRIGLQGRIAA
jgi:YVTN family beta-propeller protein